MSRPRPFDAPAGAIVYVNDEGRVVLCSDEGAYPVGIAKRPLRVGELVLLRITISGEYISDDVERGMRIVPEY